MNKLRVFNAQHEFDSRRLHQPSPNGRRRMGEGCRAEALAQADCRIRVLAYSAHRAEASAQADMS